MYVEYRNLDYTHKTLCCELNSIDGLNQALMRDGRHQDPVRNYSDAIGPQRHTKRREWE